MDSFRLVVITPQKKYFDNEVDSLSLQTNLGEITILPHHANLIANAEISVMKISYRGRYKHFAIGGGVVDVAKDGVTLILNSIEASDEIDVKRAMEEKKRAEKILLDSSSVKEHNEAEVILKKALTRIDVSGRSSENGK